MKWALIGAFMLAVGLGQAEASVDLSGKNQEILKVIENYQKQTSTKFIIDPKVRGQISILSPGKKTQAQAFEDLSNALALNGFAIVKRGDTYIVSQARNLQRSDIEVVTSAPEAKPERMVVWIYKFKKANAEKVLKNLRILLSKDGEMVVSEASNQLIITDWASNLSRVAKILYEIDQKTEKK